MVLKPVGGGEVLTITGDVIVGRNESCDIVLKSGTVSSKHARLSVQEGRLSIEDFGSTNGTFVNGERIGKPTPLKNGDRVKFDVVEFDVVMPPAGDRTQIRPSASAAPDKTVLSPGATASEAPAPVAPPKPSRSGDAAGDSGARSASAAAPEAPNAQAPKKAPGAWADPTNRPKSKTMFMSKEALQDILGPPVVPNSSLTEPHLQVLSGQSKGKNLLLRGSGESAVWKVGSEPGEDGVKLDDQGVSAFHAIIERKNNRWKVADQMSANGTFVNGAQVAVRYLSTGDKVKFGPVDCLFRVPQAAGARPKAMRLSFWPIVLISFAITVALLWLLLR